MYDLNEMYTSKLLKHAREHHWVTCKSYYIYYVVALTEIFRVDIKEMFKKDPLNYLTEEEVFKLFDIAEYWIHRYGNYDRAYFRYIDLVHNKKERIKWERIW